MEPHSRMVELPEEPEPKTENAWNFKLEILNSKGEAGTLEEEGGTTNPTQSTILDWG